MLDRFEGLQLRLGFLLVILVAENELHGDWDASRRMRFPNFAEGAAADEADKRIANGLPLILALSPDIDIQGGWRDGRRTGDLGVDVRLRLYHPAEGRELIRKATEV